MSDAQPPMLLPEPETDLPPASAVEALKLLDTMISLMSMWEKKRGNTAYLMTGWRRWLLLIRPHVAAAAERSNG